MMKAYDRKMFFKEAFVKADIERAIEKTCKILQRRLGKIFALQSFELPETVLKADGRRLSGISAFVSRSSRIRFNWLTKDTSCHIISIDFWFSYTNPLKPDIELDVEGLNIIQIIDAIEEVFNNKSIGTFKITEDAIQLDAKTKGDVSRAIKDSFYSWSNDMGIDEEKLAKTRIAQLYNNSYEYWYDEVNQNKELRKMSAATFRSYLISYMAKAEIENIFMRTIVSKEGTKEKPVVTDEVEERKFNKAIYAISLEDTFELIGQEINAVLQGFKVATLICGKAGTGKTEIVKNTLAKVSSSAKIKYMKGSITKPIDLYTMLVKNNDPNSIIVLDDCDNVIYEYKKFGNLVKAMLDPNMRIISYIDSKTGDNKKKPEEILLKSRFIIITNLPKEKIPEPIYSRTSPIEVKTDVAGMIDYLNVNIDNVYKDLKSITHEIKVEVLDFIRSIIKDVKHIDFRIFQQALIYRAVSPTNPLWRKWVYALVSKM